MRKWLLAASCTALLIAGCSDPVNSQSAAETPDLSNINASETDPAQPLTLHDASDPPSELTDRMTIPAPDNSSTIRVQLVDGTMIDVRGLFVPNASIGYYLYLLPGFHIELDVDSGTLTLNAADNDTQAVIEALPPQIDMQLAADELRTAMQLIDENMLQITEYMRHEFWADATIYRAYAGDTRITTILKSVHDIPLRITVSEPSDIQELHQIMAMISSIHTKGIETLAYLEELEDDDTLASRLVEQTYLLQTNMLQAYAIEPTEPIESTHSSANEDRDLPASNDTEQHSTYNRESTSSWISLTMDTFVQSTDDVIAYFEALYTSEAATQAVESLGLTLHNGKLRAQLHAEGSPMLWDQATLEVISETDTDRRYLARVPVDADDTEAYKLQEVRLRKTELGWRIHTPLTMSAKLPQVGEE